MALLSMLNRFVGTCRHCYHQEPDPQCKYKPQAWINVCCKCGEVGI